ncbi:MAG: hypothetical protein KDD40_08000, partial [Bdellovibrionales bacterium]|nr:hypothetical protein [Bdellovibrionales bacterium]
GIGAQAAGCAALGLGHTNCKLNGTCDGAVLGTCSGGASPASSCKVNADCGVDGDGVPGTCEGAVMGHCQHSGAIGCWSNATCDIQDVNTVCQVNVQGKCACPSVASCGPPEAMGAPEANSCLQAHGACGAPNKAQEGAYCHPNGHWIHWYSGYEEPIPVDPAIVTWSSESEGTFYGRVIGLKSVMIEGETCTPGVDTVKEAWGAP